MRTLNIMRHNNCRVTIQYFEFKVTAVGLKKNGSG